jgi:transcriptional regulator with XRE-family HTH domain
MTAPRRLTPAAVRFIRQCHRIRTETPSIRRLADRYGVSRGTVQQIQRGTRYKEVR